MVISSQENNERLYNILPVRFVEDFAKMTSCQPELNWKLVDVCISISSSVEAGEMLKSM
jgi:hypothetical protein